MIRRDWSPSGKLNSAASSAADKIRTCSLVAECKTISLTGSADEQLGTVLDTETGTATTLSLGQDVHGDHELAVGLGAARSGNDHTTAEILTADTTEKETGVVTSTGLSARLLEGLNVGDLGLDDLVGGTDDLNLAITLQETTLNTAGSDGTTTRDGENFLNGHQERLVKVTLGSGDPSVNGLQESVDTLGTDVGAAVLNGAESRAEDDGGLLTLEAVAAEKLAHFQLDELQHLRVIDGIDLVDEDNDLLDTDLTSKQQVLTSLGPVDSQCKHIYSRGLFCWGFSVHLTVGSGDDNDSTVHVGGTSDHVLDVIGVTGAVDVGVVTSIGSVLDVGRGDGDTTLTLLRSLVNGTILKELSETLGGLVLGDGSGQGGLEETCEKFSDHIGENINAARGEGIVV